MIGCILSTGATSDDTIRAHVELARSRGLDVAVRVAWEHGAAGRIASDFVDEGAERIVVVGGDGTGHEVVDALARRDALARVEFALVAGGTGNDFARSLGDAAPDLVQALTSRITRPVDAIAVGDRLALNAATLGHATSSTRNAPNGLKQSLGRFAYLVQAVLDASDVHPFYVDLTADDRVWDGDVWGVAVCNGRTVGGGLSLAPSARIDDGLLDVVLLPADATPTLEAVASMMSRDRPDRSSALRLKANSVRLEFATEIPLHVDGEFDEVRSLDVHVRPAAIQLVVGDGPIPASVA